jgi:hypothetical protein
VRRHTNPPPPGAGTIVPDLPETSPTAPAFETEGE